MNIGKLAIAAILPRSCSISAIENLEAPDRKSDPRITQALKYIESHLAEPLSLALVAERVGLCPSRLSRILATRTSLGLRGYIREIRLDRARRLLSERGRSVKEVGYSVGYSSIPSFVREFSRRYGCPPGEFQKAAIPQKASPRTNEMHEKWPVHARMARAQVLAATKRRRGRPVALLDGDAVRKNLSSDLGFSKQDRYANIRRIGFVAREVTKCGGIAVCAAIAPYDAARKDARRMVEEVGGFVLVHVATPLDVCEKRDPKGLYAKARAGTIPAFTGISDPYEPPSDSDLVVDTTGVSVRAAAEEVLRCLARLGYLHIKSNASAADAQALQVVWSPPPQHLSP